jgi:uracil permease
MALGTIVAIVISLMFEVFTRMGVANDMDDSNSKSA